MKVIQTSLPGVLVLEPEVFSDERGSFFESYNKKSLKKAGIVNEFVQENLSRSVHNVLRGIHYQIKQQQGKLVRVIQGEVFDVAVDIQRNSPNYGKWEGFNLTAENKRAIWIPPGFAHGFLVVSQVAEFLYKTTDYWAPEHERCIIWNDHDLAINWPLQGDPILSAKDKTGQKIKNAELYT